MNDKKNGFNPMRYDCEIKGCFNKMKRPKIEIFCDCFPGKIGMGDVDAIVEINAHGLVMEWKEEPAINLGQQIMWSRLTRDGVMTALAVAGNAVTMETTHMNPCVRGVWRGWEKATIDEVKQWISLWVNHAQSRQPSNSAD